MIFQIILVIAAYLIGSLPNGVIYSKLVHGVDVRELGSGNSGGTNIGRNFGLKAAVIVILADVAKGWLPIALAKGLYPGNELVIMAVGVAAVLGHAYPVWAGFKGGKIFATTIGVMLGFNFWLAIIMVIFLFITMYISSTVSLTAIISIGAATVAIWFTESSWIYRLGFSFIYLFLLYRHRDNIRRIIRGEERRLNWGLNKPKQGQ